ncbi:MAG: pilus assembly PilX family protein [Leucothrix sp.]
MNKINKKQSGITLITSLMMLLVMTIIGVTAIKISSVDILVAHNYQQRLSVYQEAETKVSNDVDFHRLHNWIMKDESPPVTTKGAVTAIAEVTDLKREYNCKGRSNLAQSLGPNAPTCKLFMFSIDARMKGSSIKENHYKGAGKRFPNQSNGSYYR